MGQETKDLINAFNESVKELHHGIDMHRCLVTYILEQRGNKRNLRSLLDLCPLGARELKLKEAIKETINILEESKKAFKSKRLEALRKKLTQILIDVN